MKIKQNYPLTVKYFPLTNFTNDKQTQKNLKINFQKTTFRANKHLISFNECLML